MFILILNYCLYEVLANYFYMAQVLLSTKCKEQYRINEMTQRIFMIGDNEEHNSLIQQALDNVEYEIDSMVSNGSHITQLKTDKQVDILIIALQRSNTQLLDSIRQLLRMHPLPVVLFVGRGDETTAARATRAGVSAYVIDGLRPDRIKPIITAAVTRFREMQKLQQKLKNSQVDLQERKLVERAKGLLMQQRGLSENEAYQTLRKIAMDKNLRIAQIAENVITVSEYLN